MPPISRGPPCRPAPRPGTVDALISQTRRLRGEVDAVRQGAPEDGSDPEGRWQRALCDLALHQLRDLDEHLAQLRDGPPPVPAGPPSTTPVRTPASSPGSLLPGRRAEWNLLTDEASWSGELYRSWDATLGPRAHLDELPSLVHDEDRPC